MNIQLELQNITRTFQDGGVERHILDRVNLQVAKGELVAVTGPSGSGKSTFLSIAGALLAPTSGQVLVDGQAIRNQTERELAALRLHKLGFIFQSAHLVPYLKVKEQLLLVAKLAGQDKNQAAKRADSLLRTLGLAHRSKAYPEKLSGGERQRAAIARALMNDPSVLLADEPTASLDAERGYEVVSLMAEQVKAAGKSAVLVTHDQRMLPLCDRVLRLENGKLTEIPPVQREKRNLG